MLKTIRCLAFISFLVCSIGFHNSVSAGNHLQTPSNGFVIFSEWHPSGQVLAVVLEADLTPASYYDQELWLYSDLGQPILNLDLDQEQKVNEIAWSQNGNRLAVNTYDERRGGQKVLIWDTSNLNDPQCLTTFPESYPTADVIGWKGDNRLATNSLDRVMILDVPTGRVIQSFTTETYPYSVSSISWSEDGAHLAAGSGNIISIWDTTQSDYQFVGTIPITPLDIYDITWSPNHEKIAISSGPNIEIWQWNSRTRSYTNSISLIGHTDDIERLDWQANYLASSSFDNTVRVWNTLTWSEIDRFSSNSLRPTKTALSLSPDGTQLAYSGQNGELVIENVLGYTPLLERIYRALAKESN